MEQLTEKHQGKIVEMAIKKTGYQMKALAKGLGIARNTLYLRLKEERLDDSFIINVSNIIHYDFSKVFPEVYKRAKAQVDNAPESVYQDTAQEADPSDALPHYDHVYKNPYFIELQVLTGKYIRLMEDYHKLLKTLTLLANSNELVGVKKEILAFLEEEDQED